MVLRAQDAWRKHPMFQNLWKNPFPGLRPAALVFTTYVVAEYAYKFITLGPPKSKQAHH